WPTPKITTRSGTPICGAASPAPLSASIVSCISTSSSSNSGVANRSTSSERSSRRLSPIFNTVLTAIRFHQLFDDVAYPHEGVLQRDVDILHADACRAVHASSRVIGDHGNRCVAYAQLARE